MVQRYLSLSVDNSTQPKFYENNLCDALVYPEFANKISDMLLLMFHITIHQVGI